MGSFLGWLRSHPAPGLTLPGWTCPTCRAFHGEVYDKRGKLVQGLIATDIHGTTHKIPRTECRSCGAGRSVG